MYIRFYNTEYGVFKCVPFTPSSGHWVTSLYSRTYKHTSSALILQMLFTQVRLEHFHTLRSKHAVPRFILFNLLHS